MSVRPSLLLMTTDMSTVQIREGHIIISTRQGGHQQRRMGHSDSAGFAKAIKIR